MFNIWLTLDIFLLAKLFIFPILCSLNPYSKHFFNVWCALFFSLKKMIIFIIYRINSEVKYIFNFCTVFPVWYGNGGLFFWWSAMLFGIVLVMPLLRLITRYFFINKRPVTKVCFKKIVMFSRANRDDRLTIFYVYPANRFKSNRVRSIISYYACILVYIK